MVMMSALDVQSVDSAHPHIDDELSNTINKAHDVPSPMAIRSTSRPTLLQPALSSAPGSPFARLLSVPFPASSPPPPETETRSSSPLSQSSPSYSTSGLSSSSWSAASSSSHSQSRAWSAMDLFSTTRSAGETVTFPSLFDTPNSSPPSSISSDLILAHGGDVATSFLAHAGGDNGLTAGSDSSEGESEEARGGLAGPVRSKRRKLDEIPNRERWRCRNDGCGREYKRTSTTSIGQHKETCSKQPVVKARAIFQLSPGLGQGGAGHPSSSSARSSMQLLDRQFESVGGLRALENAIQRESAAVLSRLGAGAAGTHLQAQANALLQAQQQMQQQTAQALLYQSQLQQQQQQEALWQQQQQQQQVQSQMFAPRLRQGGLSVGLSMPLSGHSSPALESTSFPFNSTMNVSLPSLASMSDPSFGLSSPSLPSQAQSSMSNSALLSQLSQSLSESLRAGEAAAMYPSQQHTGLSQSWSHDGSLGLNNYSRMGLRSQLLSDVPTGAASTSSYSSYSPVLPLGPTTTAQSQGPVNPTALSLMKPVARRADGADSNPAAMMGGLSSLTLQQLRQISLGTFGR